MKTIADSFSTVLASHQPHSKMEMTAVVTVGGPHEKLARVGDAHERNKVSGRILDLQGVLPNDAVADKARLHIMV